MSKILAIPDTHSEPGVSGDRFRWLSALIYEEEPDVIVHIGDHFDLASVGKYDKGTLKGEGQRLSEELCKGKEDLAELRYHLSDQRWKSIRKLYCIGNHEARLDDVASADPSLLGTVGTHLLPLDGWEVVPFLTPVEVSGVWFSHYFPSGVMNRPIGGLNAGRSALVKLRHSVVWGHSHEFHYARTRSSLTGRAIHALNIGCYFSHHHSFAGPANQFYDRGVALLHDVNDGDYDLQWISIENMERYYA